MLSTKNNIKTATYFWIGSEAEIDDCRPNYYYNYDKSISDNKRMDKAIEWLELPKTERPRLISLYFSMIDDKGHENGPNSKETEKEVLEIDKKLGEFFKKLDQINLPINVIVTSDHGMYPLDQSKKIIQEDILDWSKTTSILSDAFTLIYTKSSSETDSLFTILKFKERGRYSTYKKMTSLKDFIIKTMIVLGI